MKSTTTTKQSASKAPPKKPTPMKKTMVKCLKCKYDGKRNAKAEAATTVYFNSSNVDGDGETPICKECRDKAQTAFPFCSHDDCYENAVCFVEVENEFTITVWMCAKHKEGCSEDCPSCHENDRSN